MVDFFSTQEQALELSWAKHLRTMTRLNGPEARQVRVGEFFMEDLFTEGSVFQERSAADVLEPLLAPGRLLLDESVGGASSMGSPELEWTHEGQSNFGAFSQVSGFFLLCFSLVTSIT